MERYGMDKETYERRVKATEDFKKKLLRVIKETPGAMGSEENRQSWIEGLTKALEVN